MRFNGSKTKAFATQLAKFVTLSNVCILAIAVYAFLVVLLVTGGVTYTGWNVNPNYHIDVSLNGTLAFAFTGVECIIILKQLEYSLWICTIVLGLWAVPQCVGACQLVLAVYFDLRSHGKIKRQLSLWMMIQRIYIIVEAISLLLGVGITLSQDGDSNGFYYALWGSLALIASEMVRIGFYAVIKMYLCELEREVSEKQQVRVSTITSDTIV